MRVVCNPLGIVLCILVWVCAVITNGVTVRFVLQPLFTFIDRPGASEASSWLWSLLDQTPERSPKDGTYTGLGLFLLVLYEISIVLALAAHILAVFSDPGSTKHAPAEVPPHLPYGAARCSKCGDRWKPPRAHHCKVCKECILRMDHHCPWINNCVGLLNQKFFILFLIYISCACAINIVIFVLGAFRWFWLSGLERAVVNENLAAAAPLSVVLSSMIVCVLLVIFFFVMSLDFLSEQWEALETNTTLVETYKNTHGARTAFLCHVADVFGPHWWQWGLPIPPAISPEWAEPVFLEDAMDQSAQYFDQLTMFTPGSPVPREKSFGRASAVVARKREEMRELPRSKIGPPGGDTVR